MTTEKAKPPGQRVLVVEDEWLLASSLAAELSSVQLELVGPAATEKALDLIEQHKPDAAILDGNLGGEFAYGVAHALRARDIPFLFLTGYSRSELPDDIGDVTVLEKPCEDKEVVAEVIRLLENDRERIARLTH